MATTLRSPRPLSSRRSDRSRPFLLSLCAQDAAELQGRLRERRYGPGEVVLREGAYGDRVGLLLEGSVKLTGSDQHGREVMLAMLGPGELLGELAAIDGAPRSANIITLKASRVGFLPTAGLHQFVLDRPLAARALLKTLAHRLRDADSARLAESSHDSLGRVSLRVLELAELYGERVPEGVRIELAMTQEELASWTGTSRQTVARALRLMRQLGWVTTQRRAITVLDLEAVRMRAATG